MVFAWERPSGHTAECGVGSCSQCHLQSPWCCAQTHSTLLLSSWDGSGQGVGTLDGNPWYRHREMGELEGVVLVPAAHSSRCQLGTVLRARKAPWAC